MFDFHDIPFLLAYCDCGAASRFKSPHGVSHNKNTRLLTQEPGCMPFLPLNTATSALRIPPCRPAGWHGYSNSGCWSSYYRPQRRLVNRVISLQKITQRLCYALFCQYRRNGMIPLGKARHLHRRNNKHKQIMLKWWSFCSFKKISAFANRMDKN